MFFNSEEYFPVPAIDFLFVSRTGSCYTTKRKGLMYKQVSSSGRVFYNTTICGRTFRFDAAKLVAAAFVPMPDGLNLPTGYNYLEVNYRDNNNSNISADNLYWTFKPDKEFLLSEAANDKRLIEIPGVPHLLINKDGICYSVLTDTILKPKLQGSSVVVRHVPPEGERCYLLKRLVARTFLKEFPEGYTEADIPSLNIYQMDKNPHNVTLPNLKWGTSSTINFPHILDKRREHGPFFVIPSLRNHAINEEGDIYNLSTGNKRNASNINGYMGLVNTVSPGKTTTMPFHRLIAEVFVPPKEGYTLQECIDSLYINHKNLNKIDNRPKNLEWVTAGENNVHFFENGARKDIDRMVATNIDTGAEETYRSLSYFCQVNNIKNQVLSLARECDVLDKIVVNNLSIRKYGEPKNILSIVAGSNEYFIFTHEDGTKLTAKKKDFDCMYEKMGRIFGRYCAGLPGPNCYRTWKVSRL